MTRRANLGSLCVLLIFFLSWVPMVAAADFEITETSWNGSSRLLEVADEVDVALVPTDALDLATLSTSDAVLIVHPTRPIPTRGLSAFLRAGGRVAIVDDFGEGDALLEAFKIHRREVPRDHATSLRDNPALLIASPLFRHPLTTEVATVVTNHPSSLFHNDLHPLLAFDEDGDYAFALTGAVGQGRLVAVADSSVMINNMLALRGNRTFARNLLQYLRPNTEGRIHYVVGDAEILGRHGSQSGGGTLATIEASLRDFATTRPPNGALLILGILVVFISSLFAISALPRESPYDGKTMLPRDTLMGGFIGRVQFFLERDKHLVHPAMLYKFELERGLTTRLELHDGASLGALTEALKKSGAAPEVVSEARDLLLKLDEIERSLDHPSPPRVDAKQLHRFVTRGERLMERVAQHRSLTT